MFSALVRHFATSRAVKSFPARGPLEVHLKKILGSTRWNNLCNSVTDRKVLLHEASKLLGVTEIALLKLIAMKLGMGVMEQVPPMNMVSVPEVLVLEDFERAGCIALTLKGLITGIVCSNPVLLERLGDFYKGSNINLAPIGNIMSALRESVPLPLPVEKQNIGKTVIEQILEESNRYVATEITIDVADASCRYYFSSPEGRPLAGTIDSSVKDCVVQYLSACIAEGGNELCSVSCGCCLVSVVAQRFTIRIDRAAQHAGKLITGVDFSKKVVRGFCTKNQVLLVDDSETFSKVIERFLAKEGIATVHCNNGKRALEQLTAGAITPSLIISDVRMPETDGFSFLAALRSISALSHIPLIMLTSDEDLETELSLVRSGADAFVSKNRSPQVLKAHVHRLLRRIRDAA